MEPVLHIQADGTALLSMEALTRMSVPMRIRVGDETWDVVGWEGTVDALKLTRPTELYRFDQEHTHDGVTVLQWLPVTERHRVPIVRAVSRKKRAELEQALPGKDRTLQEIEALTREQ
jgi:hypothetical protein